jgi:hypothetical protein
LFVKLIGAEQGPAGLMQEGQKYTLWGCGKVRDSTKYFEIAGKVR